MHNFQQKGNVLVAKNMKGSVQEQVEEAGLMDTVSSWFGKVKQDRTTTFTQGHEVKTEPVFVLMLDCLAQIVKMNPTAFDYKDSYLAFIATELHTNRFWEFVQSSV